MKFPSLKVVRLKKVPSSSIIHTIPNRDTLSENSGARGLQESPPPPPAFTQTWPELLEAESTSCFSLPETYSLSGPSPRDLTGDPGRDEQEGGTEERGHEAAAPRRPRRPGLGGETRAGCAGSAGSGSRARVCRGLARA